MSMTPDSGIEHLQLFATSLGIGLLIGLERERQQDIKAGLRTFALVAVLGCISGLLTERIASTWIIAAGLFSIAAMMTAVHLADPQGCIW